MYSASSAKLGRTSAVLAVARTALARQALNLADIVAVVDAAETAPEYAGYTLRDLRSGLACPVVGGVVGTLNSAPAVDMTGVSTANNGVVVPVTVGADYFIAVLANLANITNTSAFVTASGSSQVGNYLFLGALSTGDLMLAHGNANAVSYNPGTMTGTHVFWATYRASDDAAEVAMDVVTAPGGGVGTISTDHIPTPTTYLFGGPANTWPLNGQGAVAVIGNAYRGGAENAAWRETVLGWLAERGGVSLGA